MAARKPKQPETVQATPDTLGVSAETRDGICHLSFPFSDHLRRLAKAQLPGMEFDPQAKAWVVPIDQQPQTEATVTALRAERARMLADRQQVEAAARAGIQDAKVKDAYKADNTRSSGPILAVGEFYVAQANGKNYIAIHEMGILRHPVQGDLPDQTRWDAYKPAVGEQKSILYKKGLGIVQDRAPERSHTPERARQPEATR